MGSKSNKEIKFRKIAAKDRDLVKVRGRFKSLLDEFSDYRQFLSQSTGFDDTGSKDSYPLFLARLVVLYEENFGEIIEDLNEIKSFYKLDKLRESPNFKLYNKKEGRFPNAALNGYRKFLLSKLDNEEQQFDVLFNEQLLYMPLEQSLSLITGPTERVRDKNYSYRYARSLDESQQAKIKAGWLCEFDKSHMTFISKTNNSPYIEAHHLIPMSAQIDFQNSIDFADNIIALCPTCHRNIHYGVDTEKEKMLDYFFEQRKSLYLKYNISITLSDLKKYYFIKKN